MNLQQGFPNVPGPYVNPDGTPTYAFLQFLITLWNRTGGAQGNPTDEAFFQAAADTAGALGSLSGLYAFRNLTNATYQNPGVGAVPELVLEKWARYIEVEDFGAKGDAVFDAGTSTWSGTDDTQAFLKARNWSLANGYAPVVFAGKAYILSGEISAEGGTITAPIYTQQGVPFYTPSGATIAFAPPAAGTPCFSMYGGAGQPTNKYVKGFPHIVPLSPAYEGMGIGVHADSVGAGLIVEANVRKLAIGHNVASIQPTFWMESSWWFGFLDLCTINCQIIANGGGASFRDTHFRHLIAFGPASTGYLFNGVTLPVYFYLCDVIAQLDGTAGAGIAIQLINTNVDRIDAFIKVERASTITSDALSLWNGGQFINIGAACTVAGTLGVFQFFSFENNHAAGSAYGAFTDPLLGGTHPGHMADLYAGRQAGVIAPFAIPGIGPGALTHITGVYLGGYRALGTVAANDPTALVVGVLEKADGSAVTYKAATTDISANGAANPGQLLLKADRVAGRLGRQIPVACPIAGATVYPLANNGTIGIGGEVPRNIISSGIVRVFGANLDTRYWVVWNNDGFGGAGYVINIVQFKNFNATGGAVPPLAVGDLSVSAAGVLQYAMPAITQTLTIYYSDLSSEYQPTG